jgi:hypothetical protein
MRYRGRRQAALSDSRGGYSPLSLAPFAPLGEKCFRSLSSRQDAKHAKETFFLIVSNLAAFAPLRETLSLRPLCLCGKIHRGGAEHAEFQRQDAKHAKFLILNLLTWRPLRLCAKYLSSFVTFVSFVVR